MGWGRSKRVNCPEVQGQHSSMKRGTRKIAYRSSVGGKKKGAEFGKKALKKRKKQRK